MPIVIAQKMERLYVYTNFNNALRKALFLVEFGEIAKKYQHVLTEETKIRAHLSRIFNEKHETISEPRIFSTLKVLDASPYGDNEVWGGYKQAKGYYLDLDDLANELSVPNGYFVEILLISFFKSPTEEKVLFPYETRIQAFKELEEKVGERVEALSKISSISQSHSFLAELGLAEIADELSLGYSRFEIGDYDGAIKSYRKVVEGFKNHFVQKEEKEGKKVYKMLIDNSESRTEKIVEFLSKTYSLLSNFGEHYGTHAFEEEGIFANKLVEDLAEYLTKKLKKK